MNLYLDLIFNRQWSGCIIFKRASRHGTLTLKLEVIRSTVSGFLAMRAMERQSASRSKRLLALIGVLTTKRSSGWNFRGQWEGTHYCEIRMLFMTLSIFWTWDVSHQA